MALAYEIEPKLIDQGGFARAWNPANADAHGAGRFAVLGWFRDKDSGDPLVAFQTFNLVELFARLTPPALSDLGHDFKRRIELYFLTVNALVIALLFAGYVYYGYGDRHNTVAPVISVRSVPHDLQRPDLAGRWASVGCASWWSVFVVCQHFSSRSCPWWGEGRLRCKYARPGASISELSMPWLARRMRGKRDA